MSALPDKLQLAYRQAISLAISIAEEEEAVAYPVTGIPNLERVFCKITGTIFKTENERQKLAIVQQWIVDNEP